MVGSPLGSVAWAFLLAVPWSVSCSGYWGHLWCCWLIQLWFYFQGIWFTGWWVAQLSQSIAYKELFPLGVAAHIWGGTESMFCSILRMRLWSTGWTPGLLGLLPSWNSCALCSCLLPATAFHFLRSTSQGPITPLLTPFPIFIARNFGSWLQRHSLFQHQFPSSCCWNWPLLPRVSVCSLLNAWFVFVHSTTQLKFREFCHRLGKLHLSVSLTQLMSGLCVCLQHFWLSLFIIPPSRCIFSGIRALHVEQGLEDSLKNTLRLQRVIRGIKWSQGLLSSTHLPITNNIMMVIWQIACFGHLVLLATFAFFIQLNLQCPAWQAFPHLYTWQCRSLQLMPSWHPPVWASELRHPRLTPFIRGQRSILVWELILSVQCKPWWHISCSGECPRFLVSASRLSHGLVETDIVCGWYPRELFKPQLSHRCNDGDCLYWSPRPPNSGLGAVAQQCISFVYSNAFQSFGFSVTEARLSRGLGFGVSYCCAMWGSPPLLLHLTWLP